jgi:CheY-like chemotaxis protein
VLKTLKSDPQTARIPVVILSNLDQESQCKAARAMGALDYWMNANLSLEELGHQVKNLLEG